MQQLNFTTELNEQERLEFEKICIDVGLNPNTIVDMFVRTVIREKGVPFELLHEKDYFYSEENQERLKIAADRISKTGGTIHELIEVYDD